MKKLLLALLTGVLCLSLFTACGGGDGSSSEPTGGNSTGGDSTGNPYDGYEIIDPITNGGDYSFDD